MKTSARPFRLYGLLLFLFLSGASVSAQTLISTSTICVTNPPVSTTCDYVLCYIVNFENTCLVPAIQFSRIVCDTVSAGETYCPHIPVYACETIISREIMVTPINGIGTGRVTLPVMNSVLQGVKCPGASSNCNFLINMTGTDTYDIFQGCLSGVGH